MNQTAANAVISLNNVSYAYNGGGDVLRNVNLEVADKAFCAIIGPNGGGKTTLIKLLLGLLHPHTGTVRVLGQDPAHAVPSIGYVPQHTAFEVRFPISVLDVVLLGLGRKARAKVGTRSRQTELAMQALAKVDIPRLAPRRFDTLSGGQQQRVLVARALVSSPALLLFDEPTSNIDPHGKVCLFEVLSQLSKGLTVVMVSHDIISASAGITDVAVVNERLIQGREVTPDMLQLIYGSHDSTCPLDGYIKSLSMVFDAPTLRHTRGDND